MIPVDPVIPGLSHVYFGAGQPEYVPLPAVRIDALTGAFDGSGQILTRWHFSDEDRARIAAGGDLFLSIWTFNDLAGFISACAPGTTPISKYERDS